MSLNNIEYIKVDHTNFSMKRKNGYAVDGYKYNSVRIEYNLFNFARLKKQISLNDLEGVILRILGDEVRLNEKGVLLIPFSFYTDLKRKWNV